MSIKEKQKNNSGINYRESNISFRDMVKKQKNKWSVTKYEIDENAAQIKLDFKKAPIIYGSGDKYLKGLDSPDTCYLFYSYNKNPAVYYAKELTYLDATPDKYEYTIAEILNELASSNNIKYFVFYNKMILTTPDRIYNSIKNTIKNRPKSSKSKNSLYEQPLPYEQSASTDEQSASAYEIPASISNRTKQNEYISVGPTNSNLSEKRIYEVYRTKVSGNKTRNSIRSANTGYNSRPGSSPSSSPSSRPGSRLSSRKKSKTRKPASLGESHV
jgi:hypothetical protein